MWETNFDISKVSVLRFRSKVWFGPNAVRSVSEIAAEMKARKIRVVLAVTGKNAYRSCGAWPILVEALRKEKIAYAHYDGVTPNPTTHQIDQASLIGREAHAEAVIAVGGGSAIDAAKAAAILLAYPQVTARMLFDGSFVPERAMPILAVNLTHGTGSEVNRFAVASIPELNYKPAIAFDCIYPTWSIDDPMLTIALSSAQTRYVSIDAVNHAIEAATSRSTNLAAVLMAQEAIRLIAKGLPEALRHPDNPRARYFLMYAALSAGVAFDNGFLHYTHALEHPLSALKPDLPHGLGLAALLPSVVKAIYPCNAELLADLLSPLIPGFIGHPEEADAAGAALEGWLSRVGVPEKLGDLGFVESDVEELVRLAFETPSLAILLAAAPGAANRESVEAIYRDSFCRRGEENKQ